MRIIAVVLVTQEDYGMWMGKPRFAWSFIQASSAKYVHETWALWPTGQVTGPDFIADRPEGELIKGIVQFANSQKKDGVDIVVTLPACSPKRKPSDIDSALDLWIDNQNSRVIAPKDILVVDSAKYYLEDSERTKVEYNLEKWQLYPLEDGIPGANTDMPYTALDYYKYYKTCMTELGYIQHSGKYNKQVADSKLPWEYRFSFFNHYTIFNEITEKKAADVMSARYEPAVPGLVIGSGSSLDDALPLLKDWHNPIICSSAQASTIVHYGFTGPLYIMVFDIWTRIQEIQWLGDVTGKDITLISHPGVNPELIAAWKGKKLYYRCMDMNNFFFGEVLPRGYDFINTSMLLFASSAAAQMSISNALNLQPMFYCGVDFSLRRFKKWISTPDGWKCEPDIDPIAAKPIKAENGVWTDPLQVFYKLSALTVWCIDHLQCFVTSKKSTVSEMPFVPIEEVIEKQGQGFEHLYKQPQEIEDIVELYLSKKNNFIVRFKAGGVRAVESGSIDPEGWRRDIVTYMEQANIILKRKDGFEGIDIEANMRRFEWLKAQK
jgi:hypothetical protein